MSGYVTRARAHLTEMAESDEAYHASLHRGTLMAIAEMYFATGMTEDEAVALVRRNQEDGNYPALEMVLTVRSLTFVEQMLRRMYGRRDFANGSDGESNG
jgi:hypothetical protein